MPQAPDIALVLEPETAFAELETALTALGWTRDATSPATPPILAGEPELAGFRKGDTHLSYSFNPAVMLRALSFRGEGAAAARQALAARVRCLAGEDIAGLLAEPAPERCLLGILTAGEVGGPALVDPLTALRDSPDARIARAAAKAFERLSLRMVRQGAEALAREQAQRPDRAALFPRLGDAHLRRQTLRWLVDAGALTDHALTTLRAALEDRDWEVRATAMLAAARLGARQLAPQIRRLPLPQTTRDGLVRDDRSILTALRKATVEHLAGLPVPDAAGLPPRAKAAVWARLRALVAGDAVAHRDRAFLMVHALTRPLPEETPQPERPPDAVIASEDGFHLKKSGLPLCWVPPLPHLLGADEPDLDNPPRLLTPPRGFFIARFPVSAARAAAPGERVDDSGPPHLCDWETARAFCVQLSQREGVDVNLPTADQWEMAARGPDGRRHPWGNGVEPGRQRMPSPWSVVGAVDSPPEWTLSSAARGYAIARGGDKLLRCAYAEALSSETQAAFRPIVR